MLSVQPLKSAQGAADYYTSAFNYYAGDAQALRWLGKGCERLGLTGIVEKEQMLALLEGQLPNGQVLKNKKGEHRPGFDMTFSAPKSVSILSGLGADDKLSQLHDQAVEKAIGLIEKEFAQARVVIDGKVHYVDTGNLVVAAFRQPSSRANDPALHTHGVTMNLTFTSVDGKARSLASDINGNFGVVEQLQQHVTYAGLLYRTELANLLKEQGYRLRDVGKGMFEIEGVPEEVLKEFSRRRHDIEEKMKEEGWEGSRLSSRATLLSRNAKEELDINVLRTDWQKRAEHLGFDAQAFVSSHKSITESSKTSGFFTFIKERLFERFYGKEDLVALQAKEAVFVAIETLSSQTSVFELQQLKENALKHTLSGRTIVPIQAIDAMIDAHIKSGLLYQAADPMKRCPMLTTPWALTLETETLTRIESNQGILKPIANTHAVLQAQISYEASASFPLTPSQKNALMHVFTSTDRFNAIQGYAGTGKTTMLQLTKGLASDKGFNLRGMAVTSSAVNELRDKAGICSDVFPIVHHELLKAPDNSLKNTLYILDEASMLSTTQGHELIKLIEQKGARLLLTGDDSQLSSVKCGRIFGQAQDYGISTTQMTDIIRQTNAKTKGSVRDAINRDLYDSLQKLDEVKEFKSHDERIEALAHYWLNLPKPVREKTLVFAPTHANRRDITQIVRDGLKKEGALMGNEYMINTLKACPMEEVQHHHAQYYREGMVLRFNLKLPRSGIQPGDYLTVGMLGEKHQKNKTIPLITHTGKSVALHLKDLPFYTPSRAGLNRPIEFYEATSLALCTQDKVLITRNNNQAGLVNSSLASVIAIDEQKVTLQFEKDGEVKTFTRDAQELQHLDHGYVLTNMKVQGKDKPYALGLMESYNKFSATLRNYYVQISRAISKMTLITDDKNQLLKALEYNEDTKKSALNYVNSETLKMHVHQFASNPKAIDVTAVVDKKNIHEDVVKQKQALIEQYIDAKEKEKTAVASLTAWQIMKDDPLKRMARHHLSTSESTLRQDALKFATMKLLKGLNVQEREKALTVKAYFEACTETQKAWKSIHQGNRGTLQREKALDMAEIRDTLAFKIAERIEEYRSYLHHFSIGKLNRLGVPQYRIEKGEERAAVRLKNLSIHAEKYQMARTVALFFSKEPLETKERLALFLKNQSKIIHPYLIRLSEKTKSPLDGLWREINQCAKRYEEQCFRDHLSPQEKILFDTVKTYQSLNKELAIHFNSTLYALEKGKKIPEAIEQMQREAAAARNQIAATIHNNSSCDKIFHFFKMDKEKIKQQASIHDKREAVLRFKHATSNFEQKREIALAIASDIKGYYPFIKELGMNTKTLNTLMRIEERGIFIGELNETQKEGFLKLMDYKVTSRKANHIWKSIFSDKEQGSAYNEQKFIQAQRLTAKRDNLAYIIYQKSGIQDFLVRENIDPLKIAQQARQHKARLQTINQLNQTKDSLLHQLEHRAKKMSQQEASQWHKAWVTFKNEAQRISKNEVLYQKVIQESQKSPWSFTKDEKILLSQYELEHATKTSTLKKSAYKTQEYGKTEVYDADKIAEALIAHPIETYRAIFGEPKKITSKEMRYAGGLIVSLKGSKAGFWYDFSEGRGGNPLSALMQERGVTFKDALKEGAAIAGLSGLTNLPPIVREKNTVALSEISEEKNKILSAKSILKGGISIQGTLAEKYLKERRGIENPEQLNVLFWPKGALWKAIDDNGNLYDKTNKIPALLIAAKNQKGEITGVQRVYLDENTAKKNTFMDNAKLSKGRIECSAGILQKGNRFTTLYLAEGPETGATLAMAHPGATVLVSFGLSNLKNLSQLIKSFHPNEIIIAGDNDFGSKNNTLKITIEAQEHLQKHGVNAQVIIPKNIPGRGKTDWNDVHQLQGLNQVKHQLGLIENSQNIHKLAIQRNNEQLINLEKYVSDFSKVKNQLSKTSLPRIYDEDYLKSSQINMNNESKISQKSPDIERIKQLEKSQKTMDIEL
ncbi:MobF family relaxase [Legionella sainthelensi]|uniref:MobF family relaxase n=1 Tax=Legionella sainthelensi TaxID=28087 RepID=UPI000E20613E|nr:MobF family relaxase [Legionella sainthelensi]